MSSYFDMKAAVVNATSMVGNVLSGRVSLDSFVKKYQESKQKGTNGEFITEALAKSREVFETGKAVNQADALQELLFLQMQGEDMSWLDFKISDLMPKEDYSIKMMAYTAASQMWNNDSNAIFMSTNCIRRDLTDSDPLKKSLALSLIPQIVTPELATNIASDVVACFNHSRPEISQKAICCFYQICLKFPDALRAGFAQLNVKAKLEETQDPGLQQAVLALVNELCMHNPKNFRNFVPTFYKLLSSAATPWILVRVLRIFTMILGSLETEMADKLAVKLVQPVREILDTAASASVVLEVIRLICDGQLRSRDLIQVAADRAQDFIENVDPNLRYLGLTSMTRLMKIDSKTIARHRDIITSCLESDDPTCVVLAVDLLQEIANKKNLAEFVLKLVEQIEVRPPGYVRDQLVSRVIEMCTHNDYERVTDFEWYVNVLLEIHGMGIQSRELAQQLLAIALRVESTRPACVAEMMEIMRDPVAVGTDIVETAAFILGEYATDDAAEAFELLLSPKIDNVNAAGQSVCIQNAFKLYTKAKSPTELKQYGDVLAARLPQFSVSRYTEVQERATMLEALVGIFQTTPDLEAISSLYSVPLKAIAATAQSKVPIPKSLDLTAKITDLTGTESSFDLFLDELAAGESAQTGPNPSIFILGSSTKKTTAAKKSSVVVMNGVGVEVQPKKRRLIPQTETRSVQLIPLEGADMDAPSQQSTTSALSGIDITAPLRANEKLPELRPYSQDELISKQSRHTLQLRPGSEEIENLDCYMHQVGYVQGLAINLTDVRPRSNGLEIGVAVTNSSQIPISAVEFVLDDSAPQCLRTEIQSGETGKHRLLFKSAPLNEPKVVKLTILPTGGMGEMFRAKLKIVPSFFLEPAKAAGFEAAIKKCDQHNQIDLGAEIKVQETMNRMTSIIKGTIVKTELEGQKIIAAYAERAGDGIAISIIKREENGFVMDVWTNDEELNNSLVVELKAALESESEF